MPWTIYCHTHIESGRRYIGLTKKTMLQRWNDHCYAAKRSKDGRWHFPNAIRKYGKEAFTHDVLQTNIPTFELANNAEKFTIEFFCTRDPEYGFNLSEGGSHTPHPIRKNPWDDPGYRTKTTASLKESCNEPEVRAANSATVKKIWQDPKYLENRSKIPKETYTNSEFREKLRQANLGKKASPETRAKMSQIIKNRVPASAETRRKIGLKSLGRKHTEEAKTKMSLASQGRIFTTETREKLSTARKGKSISPETREKLSTAIKKVLSDPKVRQKLSDSSKQKWADQEFRQKMSTNISNIQLEKSRLKIGRTHIVCKRHGLQHLKDCYTRIPKSGIPTHICRKCQVLWAKRSVQKRKTVDYAAISGSDIAQKLKTQSNDG